MLEGLKRRWNINSNLQLVVILVMFAITGSATVYVKKMIFGWIGIDAETELWFKIPLYIAIIFPIYQIMLLIVGTLLGQFRFAWEFEKKMFSRFISKKK